MSWTQRLNFALAAMLATTLILPNLEAQSLDELHKSALKEGGTLNFYATLAQINAEKIFRPGPPRLEAGQNFARAATHIQNAPVTQREKTRALQQLFQLSVAFLLDGLIASVCDRPFLFAPAAFTILPVNVLKAIDFEVGFHAALQIPSAAVL